MYLASTSNPNFLSSIFIFYFYSYLFMSPFPHDREEMGTYVSNLLFANSHLWRAGAPIGEYEFKTKLVPWKKVVR